MGNVSKTIALLIVMAFLLYQLEHVLWKVQGNTSSPTSSILRNVSNESNSTLLYDKYDDRRPEWWATFSKDKAFVHQSYRLPERINKTSVQVAEESFFKFLTKVEAVCPLIKRVGSKDDGGWEICVSSPFTPRTPCLVYSFGISYETSFDEAMYETYNCTVRMYDPSLNKDRYKNMKQGASFHIVQDKMIFYKVGLGAQNGLQRQGQDFWMIKTFTSLLEENNEQEVFIDVLKIDIEYAEWDSLKAMLKDSQLNFVKQLVIEIHTPDVFKTQTPIPDIRKFEEMFTLLRGLELFGFRKYFLHINHYCTGIISRASGSCDLDIGRVSTSAGVLDLLFLLITHMNVNNHIYIPVE